MLLEPTGVDSPQLEALRRQDTAERLRLAEGQLSELRLELEGAREREQQARQAVIRAEETNRHRVQELEEVGSNACG